MATTDQELTQRYLDRARAIAAERLRGHRVDVYLFGSHARGTARRHSDVDVAIDPLDTLPPGLLARLREDYEESTIPWTIDVVNLAETHAAFRERVRREGIRWIASANA